MAEELELGGDSVSLQELFSRGMGVQKQLESDSLSSSSEEGKVRGIRR